MDTYRSLLEATFRAGRKTHDVSPWQSNELAGIVFILHVIRVRIRIKPLHRRQDPRAVLVRPRHLGCHLFSWTCCPFTALTLSNTDRRSTTIKVGRLSSVGSWSSAALQTFQKASNALHLIAVHGFKVTSHSDSKFRRRSIGTNRDACVGVLRKGV